MLSSCAFARMSLLAMGPFTYGIVDDLFQQWRLRKKIKKTLETGNHRVVKPGPVQPAISAKPVVRGYDSRELFWEDALLRIDEVKRQIAGDSKKED